MNTYRSSSAQTLCTPGVDTLRWGGPIAGPTNSSWNIREIARSIDWDKGVLISTRTSGLLTGSTARLEVVQGRFGGKDCAYIETSIPRAISGINVLPVDLDTTRSTAVRMTEIATQYVEFEDVDRLRVTRVDVVDDFSGVTDPKYILNGLVRAGASRLRTSLHHDRRRHGAVTIKRGTKDRMATLYSKEAEIDGKARRARPDRPERDRSDAPAPCGGRTPIRV